MEAIRTDAGYLVTESDARNRLVDSSGVGEVAPDGAVALTWVETAYLLERGDVTSADGQGYVQFIATPPDPHALDRWLVYRDLRSRGFYASPAYHPGHRPTVGSATIVVRPRGAPPTSDEVAYRVVVVPETAPLELSSLRSSTLAVADDEGEITYISVDAFAPSGSSPVDRWPDASGHASGRRVVVPDPPTRLVDPAFFGRQLEDGTLLLNALEARYLVEAGCLDLGNGADLDTEPRRHRVYTALREAGCVPRSGLKFGADFRVYTAVEDASSPGHSAFLVEVCAADATASARELSRAVRLAGGVRKRHVVALVGEGSIDWLVVERERP